MTISVTEVVWCFVLRRRLLSQVRQCLERTLMVRIGFDDAIVPYVFRVPHQSLTCSAKLSVLYLPRLMISQGDLGHEDMVEMWASRLQNWGIGGLAPLAVDIVRPFGFLGAQALHLLSPILTIFSPAAEIDRLAALLESPEALDRLSDALSPPDRA